MKYLSKHIDYFSIANRESSSFYSTLSFTRNPANTHYTTISTSHPTVLKGIEKAKSTLKSFHHNELKTKLLLNEKYKEFQESLKNKVFLTGSKFIEFENDSFEANSNFLKDLMKECSTTKSKLPRSINYCPIKEDRYLLYDKIKPRQESLEKFKEKTKYIAEHKFLKQIIVEKTKRILENSCMQVQEIDKLMISYKRSRRLLFIYLQNLVLYVRFLNREKDKEFTILKHIAEEHNESKLELINLKEKITQQKNSIKLAKKYQVFLLCVKYKELKPSNLPINILESFGLNEYITKKNKPYFKSTTLQKSFYKGFSKPYNNYKKQTTLASIDSADEYKSPCKKVTFQNRNEVKRSTRLHDSHNELMELMHYVPIKVKTPFPIIFNNIDEFVTKMKEIENHTLELMKTHYDLLEKGYSSNGDLKFELENQKNFEDEIDILVEKLEALKKKNKILNEIKNRENEKLQKIMNQGRKILYKAIKIVSDFFNYFNVEQKFDLPGLKTLLDKKQTFSQIKGIKQSTQILCITIIEKTLIENINIYKQIEKNINFEAELSRIKDRIELRKNLENNKLKMIEHAEKIRNRNFKIIERSNKTYFLPKRKVQINYFGLNDLERRKKLIEKYNNNLNDIQKYELLTYEDN